MTPLDNDPAAETRIPVGLIADARRAPTFRAAIEACDEFELAAVGGERPSDDAGNAGDTEWFDDPRVLVVQSGVRAVVLAAATRMALALADVAAEVGVHVWRTPPIGRGFTEATEIVQRQRRRGTVYRIGSWWDHVREAALNSPQLQDGFKPSFAELDVRTRGRPIESWESVKPRAGGGVLINDAYPMIEALVEWRGLPDTVTAAVGRYRQKKGEPPRETEDVCSATLRYGDGGMTSLRVTWDIPPFGRTVRLHDARISVEIGEDVVRATTAEGKPLGEYPLPGNFAASEMRRFAAAVRDMTADSDGRGVDQAERHLAAIAIIESIYLSAVTGQPETPRRLYRLQRWEAG